MNRGKREKDFFSFSFVFLSCRWSNEGFDHSFSRALSQVGSAPKRRSSCHAPGVSQGTVARCTAMEADHAKASAKIFFLHPRQRHPAGLRCPSTSSMELRQADKKTKERLSKKDGGKGCPRSRNLNLFGILRSPPKAAPPFRVPAPIHVFKGAFVRLGPPLRLRRAT